MLGRGKKGKSAGTRVDTIVGRHTQVKGDLHFSGGLHIDGHVSGNIIADEGSSSVLTVSEHGRIEGDVRVANVILNGSVTGNVHCEERIELAAKAKVTGDVYYKLIEMAMGAEVNGSLLHQTEESDSVAGFEREHTGMATGDARNT
jgi:cytoskeletal protein CcmA (bactofilin family)